MINLLASQLEVGHGLLIMQSCTLCQPVHHTARPKTIVCENFKTISPHPLFSSYIRHKIFNPV